MADHNCLSSRPTKRLLARVNAAPSRSPLLLSPPRPAPCLFSSRSTAPCTQPYSLPLIVAVDAAPLAPVRNIIPSREPYAFHAVPPADPDSQYSRSLPLDTSAVTPRPPCASRSVLVATRPAAPRPDAPTPPSKIAHQRISPPVTRSLQGDGFRLNSRLDSALALLQELRTYALASSPSNAETHAA
ncbi:hypothetical protein B0H15DRAFT_953476 [Mycena belliarum]|uniref:Uncharacterized protein n=1 Tax=Mycena belliarum TaxID=1033014 RepID=A0AAD6XI54_9AGAR|nr:hypothetical protein B0H15DRAFT_953476 [Mycena belliae]